MAIQNHCIFNYVSKCIFNVFYSLIHKLNSVCIHFTPFFFLQNSEIIQSNAKPSHLIRSRIVYTRFMSHMLQHMRRFRADTNKHTGHDTTRTFPKPSTRIPQNTTPPFMRHAIFMQCTTPRNRYRNLTNKQTHNNNTHICSVFSTSFLTRRGDLYETAILFTRPTCKSVRLVDFVYHLTPIITDDNQTILTTTTTHRHTLKTLTHIRILLKIYGTYVSYSQFVRFP